MNSLSERTIRVGHSPDPDDAFMFYGLASGKVKLDGIKIEHLLEDIQSLNERAMRAELEVTAISAHAFPYVADKYWIMKTGAVCGCGCGAGGARGVAAMTPLPTVGAVALPTLGAPGN